METIKIETTQNVSLEYAPASVGERLLAFLIDMLVEIAYIFAFFKIIDLLDIKRFDSDSIWDIITCFFIFIPIIYVEQYT